MNRRSVIKSALATLTARPLAAFGALGLPAFVAAAVAQEKAAQPKIWRHGLSLFGDLKYPADFRHFDYVNPAAPKGGTARQVATGTFDNFNPVPAGVKGNLIEGTELMYDTLMTPSLDEASTEYGLVVEAASFPADISSAAYRLRPEARWHDGTAVTPDDVVFSFNTYKQNNPQLAAYYRHVVAGGKDRRARGHLHVRCAGQPRAAADRRPAHRAAQALVGGVGQEARHRRDHAGAAARLRCLSHRSVRAGAQRRLRAGEDLLGQGSAGRRRNREFRRDALRVFPRLHGRARGVQGRSGRLAHREQRQELGDRLRFPGGARQSACCWRNSRSAMSASCRPSPSTSGATSSRTRACAAPSTSPSISRR